jgi:hypothetical protein
MVAESFLILFGIWGVLVLALHLLHKYGGVRMCRIMRWHLAPTHQNFDGASLNGKCPRCGEFVMQDSQGNWF